MEDMIEGETIQMVIDLYLSIYCFVCCAIDTDLI